MKLLSVNKTLNKDGSDFKNWLKTINTKIIKNVCPKCGSDVLCAYTDMGTTDFCDTYHHICMNLTCNYLGKKDEFGIGMGVREYSGPSPCPFCQRSLI